MKSRRKKMNSNNTSESNKIINAQKGIELCKREIERCNQIGFFEGIPFWERLLQEFRNHLGH
jgi:hypothetical protein